MKHETRTFRFLDMSRGGFARLFLLLLLPCLSVIGVKAADSNGGVKFNPDVRYSQWAINSRLHDFYGNQKKFGFDFYDNNGNYYCIATANGKSAGGNPIQTSTTAVTTANTDNGSTDNNNGGNGNGTTSGEVIYDLGTSVGNTTYGKNCTSNTKEGTITFNNPLAELI